MARDVATSNLFAAHPYSLSCSAVSHAVLGELKKPLVSNIRSLDLISPKEIGVGLLNSGSKTSASSNDSRPYWLAVVCIDCRLLGVIFG